jgi:hypothetical protein
MPEFNLVDVAEVQYPSQRGRRGDGVAKQNDRGDLGCEAKPGVAASERSGGRWAACSVALGAITG